VNASGALLIVAGVWLLAQLIGGSLLTRIGV
jgi:hypothetical protein